MIFFLKGGGLPSVRGASPAGFFFFDFLPPYQITRGRKWAGLCKTIGRGHVLEPRTRPGPSLEYHLGYHLGHHPGYHHYFNPILCLSRIAHRIQRVSVYILKGSNLEKSKIKIAFCKIPDVGCL